MVDSFFAVGLSRRGRMRQKNRFLYGLNKQRERENEGGREERKEARDERKEEREEGWRANERSQNEKRG